MFRAACTWSPNSTSLTGFSLVGGPAYNDSKAAEEILATLDVPYLSAHPVEFQTLEQWGASDRGLMPVESTIMVAIPELDGATGPMIFGGRSQSYENELASGVSDSLVELEKQAERLGADAVIGVDLDYESVGANMLMISASGTAVKLT